MQSNLTHRSLATNFLNGKQFNTFRAYFPALKLERLLVSVALIRQTLCAFMQGLSILVIVPLFAKFFGQTSRFKGSFGWIIAKLDAQYGAIALIFIFIILGILGTFLRKKAEDTASYLRLKIEGQLREDMLLAVSQISWPGFTDLRLGSLSKTILADCARYADGTEKIVRAVSSFLFTSILLGIAFITAPKIVLILGLALGLGLIFFRSAHKQIGFQSSKKAQAARNAANTSFEMINHWKFVKSSGMTELFLTRARTQHKIFSDQSNAISKSSHTVHALFEAWSFIIIGSCLFYGTMVEGTNASENIAAFGLFLRLIPHALTSQRNYDGAKTHQHSAITWQNQYDMILLHAEKTTAGTPFKFEKELVFRSVAVDYIAETPGKGALRNLSFCLPKFGCLAIIGSSGSGKTTAIDVISGLLKPSAGEVLIDGKNLNDIDLLHWQKQLAMVTQSVPLFYGTITENIALGEDRPDFESVRQAAALAQAEEFIRHLPKGFETNIGEGGIKLSGGQRQRLAIARALYKKPALLLLDEVTSSLDAANEEAVTETIKGLKGKITMVIISHRQSTTVLADQIIELAKGEVIS